MRCRHSFVTDGSYARFRGSKYVQSDIGDSYVRCKEFLDRGERVLFTGTPCQALGLRRFLAEFSVNRDRLTIVDFVCHGVPSQKVLDKYIKDAARRFGSAPTGLAFRHKRKRWQTALDTLLVVDGKTERDDDSPYMLGFMVNLFLRPSCRDCAAKGFRSGADVTIGDFWGGRQMLGRFDDGRGVSLVMVNTAKGEELFGRLAPFCDTIASSVGEACAFNHGIYASSGTNKRRGDFFAGLDSEPFGELYRKTAGKSATNMIRRFVPKEAVNWARYALWKARSALRKGNA
jgi:hypothetical protein